MKKLLILGGVACLLAVGPQTALGVIATNMTTGEVVFDSGGFEGEALGVVPSPTSAVVGSWRAWYIDEVITGGAPGAYEGTKYVRTIRDATNAGGPEAHFAAEQFFAGDEVHIEWMMWNASGNDSALVLANTGTYYRGLGRITGGTFRYYDGAAYIDTGLAYLSDTWQKWEIDYTIGANTFTVTVGGSSAVAGALDGISTPGGGPLEGIYFAHNGYNTYFLDAVPEPSAMILLAAGACALLRRGRRHCG